MFGLMLNKYFKNYEKHQLKYVAVQISTNRKVLDILNSLFSIISDLDILGYLNHLLQTKSNDDFTLKTILKYDNHIGI